MKKILIIFFLLTSFSLLARDRNYSAYDLFTNPLLALKPMYVPAVYYVSPWTGNDTHSGTDTTNAWATWQKAFDTADAGDTVYFRGGTWYPTTFTQGNYITVIDVKARYSGTVHGHTGLPDNPICFFNYPGEEPILDCSMIDPSGHSYLTGIYIADAHFLHFRGLKIRNIWQRWQYGVIRGVFGINTPLCSNLTFEKMEISNLGGKGISFGSNVNIAYTPTMGWDDIGYIPYDTTRFINNDIHNLCDTLNYIIIGSDTTWNPGNAADGIKTDSEKDGVLYYTGNRIWEVSDDGIDQSGTGEGIFVNNWSFNNGWYDFAFLTDTWTVLEGDGFKMGIMRDSSIKHTVIARNNIAAGNRGIGFYDLEYNPTAGEDDYRNNARYYNNFAYKCATGYASSGNARLFHNCIWRNNITYQSTTYSINRYIEVSILDPYYTEDHNTWDNYDPRPGSWPFFQITDTVTVTDADFISLDTTQLDNPRNADGTLPTITFGRLSGASDLIGAGTDVGMTATPDIGIDWTYYDATYATGSEEPPPPEQNVIPTIYSNNATTIKSINAILGGNVTSDGGATVTARGVCYSTSPNPDLTDLVKTTTGTTGSFSITLTGLQSNTTYYVRAYATNSAGTAYGSEVSFTTTTHTIVKINKPIMLPNGKLGAIINN